MYGYWGSALAVLLTPLGASGCYIISQSLLTSYVHRHMETHTTGKLARLRLKIETEREKGNLFFYLIFLRLFPFTPNWALNLASPVLGVPMHIFSITVLIGLAPYNIVTTQAGAILTSLDSLGDIMRPELLLKLALVALMSLVPIVIKRRAVAQGVVPNDDELAQESKKSD
jgi:uncharacterized membrane protein YdjX (TVP38/TMEM64 family)